jgi:hypothetical protein
MLQQAGVDANTMLVVATSLTQAPMTSNKFSHDQGCAEQAPAGRCPNSDCRHRLLQREECGGVQYKLVPLIAVGSSRGSSSPLARTFVRATLKAGTTPILPDKPADASHRATRNVSG